MATKEQMREDEEQFGMAFDEPDKEVAEQSEDEAFGLSPDAAPAAEGGDTPAVAVVIEGEAPAEEAEVAADEGVEAAPTEDWEQKYKTLQGKYNAEIAAKKESAAASAPTEEGPSDGEGDGDAEYDAAVAMLTADFGDEFIDAIKAVARGEALRASGEAIGEVGMTVEAIISDMNDSKQRAHFEKIYDAHPDFMDIAEQPRFIKYITENPELQEVVENGSAREVIDLLDGFKTDMAALNDAGNPEAAPQDSVPPTDDAEGVRSTGLRLPESPAQSQDFKDAWDQF